MGRIGGPAVMLQGTGSDVGKSMLAAGLCRYFTRRGYKVAPFKPQNMSNNAAVTADGGEIGRAQALQALACGIEPHSDMNPVLLKPESDRGSQVVVQGRATGVVQAADYAAHRRKLMVHVLESYRRLSSQVDLMIVEGAGSCSEVNLREGDIANMGFALAANVPVVLAADIDRGGAIASVVGSHLLFAPEERALVHGYLVNKFRGDPAVFAPAVDIIRSRTELDCLGVVHWFGGARLLPAEDSMALERRTARADGERRIKICVLEVSRISNFDDFDPLAAEPDVDLSFVRAGEAMPGDADLAILPGTKSTIGDLAFLRAQGWDVDIAAHLRRGGHLLGICGGYQMLGCEIRDPEGLESAAPTTVQGLGYLDTVTTMAREKTLTRFRRTTADGIPIEGYEIHIGRTEGPGTANPMLVLDGRPEGAVGTDGRVGGCYVHGLFTGDAYRARFLSRFREGGQAANGLRYGEQVDRVLNELADRLADELDVARIARIAGL